MYKKDAFKKLDAKYNTHLYTGLLGYAMRYCQRQLEKFDKKEKYSKVLEVGAGSEPHLNYLKHDYDEYFIAETSDYALEFYKGIKNIKVHSYDGKKLPFNDNFFDRIIISHCLEHVMEPEKFLFEMMSKLKKGGVLSISLPTDPGLLWRLGRLFIRYFIIKYVAPIARINGESGNFLIALSILIVVCLTRNRSSNVLSEFFFAK